MAKAEQVLGHDGGRLFFVGFHRVGHGRIVVDHRHRHAAFDELRKVVVVGQAERRPHDEAIDAAIEQAVDLLAGPRLRLFRSGACRPRLPIQTVIGR